MCHHITRTHTTWGLENNNIIRNMKRQFYSVVLSFMPNTVESNEFNKMRKKNPNFILYGETKTMTRILEKTRGKQKIRI